jgi:predicted enzyme related to lactoylglutathione lyase
MSRVIHFEIPADDPARAEAFYTKSFGWKFTKWDGPMSYWLIRTGEGPGIDGGMAERQHPGHAPCNTIGVDSLDDSTKKVLSNGGKVTLEKCAVPGVGWLAYFTDPEGNPFGLMQADPNAK